MHSQLHVMYTHTYHLRCPIGWRSVQIYPLSSAHYRVTCSHEVKSLQVVHYLEINKPEISGCLYEVLVKKMSKAQLEMVTK